MNLNAHVTLRLPAGSAAQARLPTFKATCAGPISPVSRVLVLKAELQMATTIAASAAGTFPDAEIVIAQSVKEAADVLACAPVDLLISGLGMIDGDTCGLIRECAAAPRRAAHILIVTRRRSPWVLKLLHELPIDGAFDSRSEEAGSLAGALRRIVVGRRYFSETFLRSPWAEAHPLAQVLDDLTPGEALVLAVLGDGCDRKTAAHRVNIGLGTIRSHCEELHAKLAVHHDRDLIRIAAQLGLVSMEEPQVLRLGFELLVERYERAQKVKRPRPAFIAALCARRASCRSELRADSAQPFPQAS